MWNTINLCALLIVDSVTNDLIFDSDCHPYTPTMASLVSFYNNLLGNYPPTYD